ncbi:MAG: hypothetical protein ABI047_11100 [Jatrophihabitantaceae bacterium]
MNDHVAVLNAAIAGKHPIDDTFATALAEMLDTSAAQSRQALMAATRSVGLTPQPFELRTGQWRLDATAAVAKAVACASVSAIVLEALGQTSVTATVLSIVAPFLFEIERIEISAGDVYLHGRLLQELSTAPHKLRDAWAALPPDLRDELPMSEFVSLVERLTQAQLATMTAAGIVLSPSGPGSRGFRLYLH